MSYVSSLEEVLIYGEPLHYILRDNVLFILLWIRLILYIQIP